MEDAMAIDVRYPDGSYRAVPSELRAVDNGQSGAQARFHHRPVNSDPLWRFYNDGTTWHARPRHGALSILVPPVDHWWQGIAAMADAPALPDMSDQASRSHRAA
ncbi:hypothetical protein YGS_C1P2940 [Sphingobium sp. YG1]|jgi:hypothetical protein|nr:hypothetical protein YGS_C1P2940 [Sphingobium sp. YG1]